MGNHSLLLRIILFYNKHPEALSIIEWENQAMILIIDWQGVFEQITLKRSFVLLVKLAWKNVWRNKHRSLITMSSVFCAVILAVLTTSLQDGVFDNLVKNVVSFHSGYLQIHRAGYWDDQTLDNGMVASGAFEDTVLAQEGIRFLAPRLESFALASSKELTKGCLVSGILPDEEHEITQLKEKLIGGEFLNEKDEALLVASGLAGQLSLGVNDTMVLIGQGYHGALAAGKYPIKGILKFGSPELNNEVAFMPLAAAQNLFGAEEIITTYVLSLHDPSKLQEVSEGLKNAVSGNYEIMTWEEIAPEISQHIKTDKGSMYIIIGVLYLLIFFGILGTQLMMMVERRRELGMLIAIGMSRTRLISSTIIELVMTVLVGCIVGVLLSVPLVYYLNQNPIRFTGDTASAYEQFGFEPIFPTSTEAVHFWSQGLIVLIIGLALSLYPAISIFRLEVTKALNRR